MARVTTKPGVRFGGFTAALCRILTVVEECARPLIEPPEVVITSGSDGTHKPTSQHYTFSAVDIRTRNFTPTMRARFAASLAARLGPKFTVLDEGDHWHVQVKKGGRYP